MTESIAAGPPETVERKANIARVATASVAAFLSLLAVIRYGASGEAAVSVCGLCVLVVLSRHDLERRVIPNRIVVPAWIAILVARLAIDPDRWAEWIVGSVAAGAFFLVFALARPGGLGLGDVKLALLIGALLGWDVVPALLIGTLASAAFAIALLIREGAAARKRTIPLGPFLAAGAIVTLLFL
jgi:leader peptidase (prepilin peptidase) / N-methyltransferase